MQFSVVERIRDGDTKPIFRRLRDHGRLLPDGVAYVASWVAADLTCCYQIMESDGEARLRAWTAQWDDLVDFEVVPVITSADAREAIAPRL